MLNWLFRKKQKDESDDYMSNIMPAELTTDNSPASKATDRLVAGSADLNREGKLRTCARLAGTEH